MKPWNSVAIIGVGLIGGSLGRDLLRRGLARQVVGIGRRTASLSKARRLGLVSQTTTNLARGVAEADVVIAATPVGRIAEDLVAAARHAPPGVLLTDAGSTKATIVAEVEAALGPQARFVGSHPIAGSERSGPTAATADLFQGRMVVLTPTARTRPEALRAVRRLWKGLGARLLEMSPEAHDRALAATSHLPHFLASALAAATRREDLPLVAGGWLDCTRIAAGDAALWTQIFAANRGHLLTALGQYEKVLSTMRRALESAQDAELQRLLQEGKNNRNALGS